MIKEQRKVLIIDFLRDKGIVKIENLISELNIPLTTLRRDLLELDKEGLITKMHGGVEYRKTKLIDEEFLDNKMCENIDEKEEIAIKAAKLINPNESIFLDSGSSAYYLAKKIDSKLNVKIVTNSIYNLIELVKNGHEKVYLLGGKFTNVTGAIIGYEAIKSLENYSFDKSFLGINAVDEEGNIYTTNSDHAQVKIEIIKRTSKNYGLSDSSKFKKKSFYKFSDSNEIQLIK